MEISNFCTSLMECCNIILLSITVIFVVVMVKTVIFRKENITGRFPVIGIISSTWLLSKILFKPMNEVLLYVSRKYGRTYWLTNLNSRTFYTGDPHLIKLMCVKNFQCFSLRLKFPTIRDTILDNTIMFLQNPKWKVCRSALSPIFTSSKMKKMSPLIENCIQILLHNLSEFDQQALPVDIKSILDRFTLDVIAVSAFDFSLICNNQSREEFLSHSLSIISQFSGTRLAVAAYFPWIYANLGIEMFPRKSVHYFETLVKNTIEERRNTMQSQTKADLIQLLLKQGKQVLDEDTSIATKEEFSIEEITSNCISFLMAGFETTSTALCSIIYLLAQNPSCQEKLLDEIETAKNATNSPNDMPYLEAVISESMRLFPPFPFVARTAVNECHVDDIFFPKDTIVIIPISAIHRDPEYFSDPDVFLPNRFLTGNYNVDAFMPFGMGPRKCIGALFSLIEIRSTLIQLVQNFKFISAQKELRMKANTPLLVPKELFVKIEKRKD